MNQYKASIIIVYTNSEKLAEAEKWIHLQTISNRLQCILLDNSSNVYTSCAQALNRGAEQALSDILIFMHQDVYLWDVQAAEKYCNYLEKNPDAILGVAGVPADMDPVTDLYETTDKLERGIRANGKEFLVEALDECLLAMTRDRWKLLRFDEMCCDNWHGYGMDICYHNTLQNGRNILLPLQICHDSLGTPHSASYRATIKNLVRKYRGTAITRIRGTCIQIPCNWWGYYWYSFKQSVRNLFVQIKLIR